MKKLFYIIFSITHYCALAQETTIQENVKDRFRTGDLGVNNSSRGTFYGFDNSKSEVVGTAYYDADWHKYNIKFYPQIVKTPLGDTKLDSVSNIPCRFNLKDNLLEFRVDFQTKYVGVDLVKNINDGKKILLVNVREFESEKFKSGMVEELASGYYGLYIHYQIIIKKPDYSAALNTGSKDVRVLKEKKLALKVGNKLYAVSGKKSFSEILGNKFEIAEQYMSKNDLSYKEINDVIALVGFLNANP